MGSKLPKGAGAQVKKGRRTHAGLLPFAELEQGTQAPAGSCPRLRFGHRQSCSPVGTWAWQGVVAAPCGWGAASVIAHTEDPELVARLATRIERPVGHQREVVALLGEVGRDWGVLHSLWGDEVLGG